MYTLLILQFAAHLLADFHFQSQKWSDQKDRKMVSEIHFYHALIVFACSWTLSLSVSFWWAALLITLFHFGLDTAKSRLFQKEIWVKALFFIDQALHIAVITCVVALYSNSRFIFSPFSIHQAFVLFALIACAKPSNIFIKKYMEANHIFPIKKGNNTLINAGRIIGSLERLLSFILISFNQFAAVGFIIAAKSILRFRDTDTAKTEYLLIGSLLSFGIAISFGIAYQLIN